MTFADKKAVIEELKATAEVKAAEVKATAEILAAEKIAAETKAGAEKLGAEKLAGEKIAAAEKLAAANWPPRSSTGMNGLARNPARKLRGEAAKDGLVHLTNK